MADKHRPMYIVHADTDDGLGPVALVITPDQVLRKEEGAEDVARKLVRDGFIHGWLREDYEDQAEKAPRSALFARQLVTITVKEYGDV